MNTNRFAVLEEGDADTMKTGDKAKNATAGKKFKPATTTGAEEQKTERAERAPRRGREFDRHVSGTGHLKGENKKGGAGKGNWGVAGSEIAEETAVKAELENENKEESPKEVEPEEKTLTLAEYRKQQAEKAAAVPAAKTGRSAEESAQWKDTVAAPRDQQEVWSTAEKKEKEEKEKTVKQKVVLETAFKVHIGDRESTRGGRGRGRGRRDDNGERRERRPREERPAEQAPVEAKPADAEAAPAQPEQKREGEHREFRGRGRGRGGRGGMRGGRGGQRGGRGAPRGGRGGARTNERAAINLQDEAAFPKLG